MVEIEHKDVGLSTRWVADRLKSLEKKTMPTEIDFNNLPNILENTGNKNTQPEYLFNIKNFLIKSVRP